MHCEIDRKIFAVTIKCEGYVFIGMHERSQLNFIPIQYINI